MRFGPDRVPGFVSFPCGEAKIAFDSVPSTPSQLESRKRRSGWSGAPGLIVASVGPQSWASTTPSPSVSRGVGFGVGVGVGAGVGVGVSAGRFPWAVVARNNCPGAWFRARSTTRPALVRAYRTDGFAASSTAAGSASDSTIVRLLAVPTAWTR